MNSVGLRLRLAGVSILMCGLVACGDSDSPASTASDEQRASDPGFSLQVLHFADMDGSDTTALASVASLSALVSKHRAEMPDNTLVLSSGDNYIPGPRFNASSDDSLSIPGLLGNAGAGRADIALLNRIGVQAAALGNHELDLNPGTFASIVGADEAWPGAAFPYLADNVDFTTDADTAALVASDGTDAASAAGKVSGWVTVEVAGQKIGIIGASSPSFPTITSTGGLTFNPAQTGGGDFDINALAAVLQRGVDEIRAAGINKIVMLAHMQQIEVEKQLAARLSGVDIIIAGGSNTLLADADDVLRDGEAAADTYPLQINSIDNEPVVVLNTGPDYKYLGRFIAPFDEDGVLVTASFDATKNGAVATSEDDQSAASAQPDLEVVAVRDALNSVLIAKDGNVPGYTSVFLEGRRAAVRNEATNFGNLTADANLWYAQQAGQLAQVSLKNGGGIRAEIGQVLAPPGATSAEQVQLLPPAANPVTGRAENGVSQLAIETALRFDNKLWVFDVSLLQLKQLLEHAVSSLGSRGQFPQVGGMAFSYDPAGTAQVITDGTITVQGNRIRTLTVADQLVVSDGAVLGDPNQTVRMVTLNFLAGGGDGYPFPSPLPNLIKLEEVGLAGGTSQFSDAGGEQDAIAEYLQQFHGSAAQAFNTADTAETLDTRIQNLAVRSDGLQP